MFEHFCFNLSLMIGMVLFACLPASADVCDSVISTITDCRPVDVDNDNNIYAGTYVSGSGVPKIYKSTDSAATWDLIYSGIGSFVSAIFVASNNYVYAGARWTGCVVRTTNGGVSWDTCLSFKNDSSLLWQMAEDTSGNLFIGEYSETHIDVHRATIWKSTSNGATWDTIYHDPNLLHIHSVAVDPSTNYLYATTDVAPGDNVDKRVFLRSTDGGTMWDTIATSNHAKFTGIEFSSNYRILADDFTIPDQSDIFITDDDSTFTSVYRYPHGWFRDICRIDDSYYAGIVLTNHPSARLYLIASYDEGKHWGIVNDYNVGHRGEILNFAKKSVHGWVYYTYLDSHHVDGQLRKFRETSGNDVKDETESREKPSEFSLSQNYPNPFNQTTKI
ncbi:hypothetical protein KA005_13525, partial [bacterium]|nr:hypothetical protein [bacterium]